MNCKDCRDPKNCPFHGGWIVTDESGHAKYHICDKYSFYLKQLDYEKHNLVKGIQNKTFANFIAKTDEEKRVLCKCQEFVKKKPFLNGQGLALLGTYGVGKTHLSAAIYSEISKTNTVMFVSPACIKGSFEEIQEYFDLMKEPDLLIIDDLGNEINNQFFIKEFYKLIDYRYIYKKGIILNTNLSVDGLIALLGDRTIDRLREMVLFFIFKTTQSKRVSIQDWC